MKSQFLKPLVSGVSGFAMIGMASAATTTLFMDDFEDGNSTGWSASSYSNDGDRGGPNATSPTQTNSVVSYQGGSGLQLNTVMFDKDTNPSWAGTQLIGPSIPAAMFTGRDVADIRMGFQFSVTADPGQISTVRFELREQGGITTHRFSVPVSDIAGGVNDYSFTLDMNQNTDATNSFTSQGGFDPTRDKVVYVQIQDGWAINGSTRNISLTTDNFSITAVPETTSALLGLMGAGLILVRRRR